MQLIERQNALGGYLLAPCIFPFMADKSFSQHSAQLVK